MPPESKDTSAETSSKNHWRVSNALRYDGFSRFAGKDIFTHDELDKLAKILRKSCADLPLDPYCDVRNRYRRFTWLVVLPWSKHIDIVPPEVDPSTGLLATTFHQDLSYNSEAGGIVRRLAPVAEELLMHELFRRLLFFDLDLLSWWSDCKKPLICGIHLQKLIATPGLPAGTSPPEFHRDGQPWTFSHLIDRQDAINGRISIAPALHAGKKPYQVPPEDLLAQFTPTAFLDSYSVKDIQVSHHAASIEIVPGREQAVRSVMLIDFAALEASLV